jgi:hypothetical protein
MELDCTMYDNVTLEYVAESSLYPIRVRLEDGKCIALTKYGQFMNADFAKCVIFPKGKTTWEGFQRPFKDGDIVYNRLQKRICIYYYTEDEIPCINHCRYNEHHKTFEILNNVICIAKQDYRLATEEEKQRFFDIIKANGYMWNIITKTLERMSRLMFKNGDIVATTSGAWIGITTGGASRELIPTHCVIKSNGTFEAYTDVKKAWCFSRFATKEERQKLFDEIEAHGYTWNAETKTLEKLIQPQFKVGNVIQNKDGYKVRVTEVNIEDECYGYESAIVKGIGGIAFREQDNWELVPNKFDINILKPFESRVLVRDYSYEPWRVSFWGCLLDNEHGFKYDTIRGPYKQCIPYEGNGHLLGRMEDCADFYKNWE